MGYTVYTVTSKCHPGVLFSFIHFSNNRYGVLIKRCGVSCSRCLTSTFTHFHPHPPHMLTVSPERLEWSTEHLQGKAKKAIPTGAERTWGGSMPTDQEPTFTVKLLQLVLLSTYWGMQIWVTFISSFVMDNHLNRHTYGFIQSRLVPFYLHLGSACAFFNLTIYAVYHPSDMLNEKEAFQIFIFFVSVTVAAVNAQWFGQMTSEIMADMHLIEQACGLGQDIGLSSNREAYAKLCETDVKYRHLSSRLWLYRLLSSLCNLCCIGCNFYSLCYMAENLVSL
ncbi:uncharacterized protein V6R79_019660 [Siganus canaliculatus]